MQNLHIGNIEPRRGARGDFSKGYEMATRRAVRSLFDQLKADGWTFEFCRIWSGPERVCGVFATPPE